MRVPPLLNRFPTSVLSAASQTPPPDTILDALFAMAGFRQVAISPDGRELAFLSDEQTPGQSQLYIAPAAGHNFIAPNHRRDLMRRVAFWFDHYLKKRRSGQRTKDYP